jgi:hypothetical protein
MAGRLKVWNESTSSWEYVAYGLKGDTGTAGSGSASGGATGATGPKGDTGSAGSAGSKGDTGSAGSAGPTGPTGPKGDTGSSGSGAGTKGDTGSAGSAGATGPKGDTGSVSDNWTLTAAPSDHAASGMIIPLTAAATLAFGDVCYINSSGQAALVDADAIASASGLVMAVGTISSGSSGNFLLFGIARDDTWNWTIGGLIYITVTGTTGNTLSQSQPSGVDDVIQIVGVATHADRMLFSPQLVQVERTA